MGLCRKLVAKILSPPLTNNIASVLLAQDTPCKLIGSRKQKQLIVASATAANFSILTERPLLEVLVLLLLGACFRKVLPPKLWVGFRGRTPFALQNTNTLLELVDVWVLMP